MANSVNSILTVGSSNLTFIESPNFNEQVINHFAEQKERRMDFCFKSKSSFKNLKMDESKVKIVRVEVSSKDLKTSIQVNSSKKRQRLRPIILEGEYVGKSTFGEFLPTKLEMYRTYFKRRGHQVVVFMPHHCINQMKSPGTVVLTPTKKLLNTHVAESNKRPLVQFASQCGGVIVTTEEGTLAAQQNYNDLVKENPSWREAIEERTLIIEGMGESLLLPKHPKGSPFNEFLKFPEDK